MSFLLGKKIRPQERAEMYQAYSFVPNQIQLHPPHNRVPTDLSTSFIRMFAPAIQETFSRHLRGMGCSSESSAVNKEDRICQQIPLTRPLSGI